MRVSFTGTREGMSEKQKNDIGKWATANWKEISIFAHGNCMGADFEAHTIFRSICGPELRIAIFPSTCIRTQMPIPSDAWHVAPPKAPLDRDRDIVDCGCDILLAAPFQVHEVRRSGTWATLRYARDRKKIPYKIFRRE